jgi:hypothetical protein
MITLINLTAYAWIAADFIYLSRWQQVCKEKYKSQISKIIKYDKDSYGVVCK